MTNTPQTRLSIVYYPDPILRKKAAPVARITPELAAFADEMADLMHESDGVGLAAPQVGVSLRIIVVDVGDGVQAVFNPVILTRDGSQTGPEGCLSLPSLHGDVTRADRVTVQGLNKRGKKITISGEGFWARAMQHEIDHLDGIIFIDHVIEETLHWASIDAKGEYHERATSLQDALRVFEQQALATRA